VTRSLLVLLLIACGCAASRKETRPTLARTRSDPAGVCFSTTDLGGNPWHADKRGEDPGLAAKLLSRTVQVCARAEPSEDQQAPGLLDITLIFAKLDDRWRPQYWHAEVIRSNGLVIEAGDLGPGRIEDGSCFVDECRKEGHATLTLSEPWETGHYRVRLTHVPTRLKVDIPFSLE